MTTIDEDVVTLSVLDDQMTEEERAALARLVAAAREGETNRRDIARYREALERVAELVKEAKQPGHWGPGMPPMVATWDLDEALAPTKHKDIR